MLINEMIIFYYVIEFKSFSQAALKLEVSKSYISKHVTKLEHDLKVQLLNRNTRQISLTDEGEIFYGYCKNIFKEAQIGYDVIADIRKQPSGVLKISIPPALAIHVLTPVFVEFSKKYPDVCLNISLDSDIVDITQHGYDLALRSSLALPDSNLVARKVGKISSVLCASPAYLQKYDNLKSPEQLTLHKLGIYSSGKTIYELKLVRGRKIFSVVISPYLQSNSLDQILQMVKAGLCMAILPQFMIKHELDEGRLIACLPKYNLSSSDLYAVYSNKNFMPLRVSAFIELIKMQLKSMS